MELRTLGPDRPPWPDELAAIDGPPACLWARGRTELLEPRVRVAVVGSRAPTPYGRDQAARFARALAERGVVVVSGLARGVDACAHRAALEVGGDTIAVLGSGVDRPWPNDETTEAVLARGLVLSEFPPGTGPRRHHFPLRNRILSGLSAVVLVVEAAQASGSLITARWAADQGRTVFAVPGRVDHPMARGCHRLLREGASLAEEPGDLLRDLGLDGPDAAEPTRLDHPLLRVLEGETLDAEQLALRTKTAIGRVLSELVQLELAGRVARAPGGLYRLVVR